METRVKICGITSVADGQMAAEAGADMIGLMFYERSPRRVTLAQAAEISKALPPFVMRVGVFVNPDEAFVLRAIAECGLGLLQFHGDETSDFCTQFGLMSLKAFRVRDAAYAHRRALELGAWDMPTRAAAMELLIPGIHGVGEIQRHQRLEMRAGW